MAEYQWPRSSRVEDGRGPRTPPPPPLLHREGWFPDGGRPEDEDTVLQRSLTDTGFETHQVMHPSSNDRHVPGPVTFNSPVLQTRLNARHNCPADDDSSVGAPPSPPPEPQFGLETRNNSCVGEPPSVSTPNRATAFNRSLRRRRDSTPKLCSRSTYEPFGVRADDRSARLAAAMSNLPSTRLVAAPESAAHRRREDLPLSNSGLGCGRGSSAGDLMRHYAHLFDDSTSGSPGSGGENAVGGGGREDGESLEKEIAEGSLDSSGGGAAYRGDSGAYRGVGPQVGPADKALEGAYQRAMSIQRESEAVIEAAISRLREEMLENNENIKAGWQGLVLALQNVIADLGNDKEKLLAENEILKTDRRRFEMRLKDSEWRVLCVRTERDDLEKELAATKAAPATASESSKACQPEGSARGEGVAAQRRLERLTGGPHRKHLPSRPKSSSSGKVEPSFMSKEELKAMMLRDAKDRCATQAAQWGRLLPGCFKYRRSTRLARRGTSTTPTPTVGDAGSTRRTQEGTAAVAGSDNESTPHVAILPVVDRGGHGATAGREDAAVGSRAAAVSELAYISERARRRSSRATERASSVAAQHQNIRESPAARLGTNVVGSRGKRTASTSHTSTRRASAPAEVEDVGDRRQREAHRRRGDDRGRAAGAGRQRSTTGERRRGPSSRGGAKAKKTPVRTRDQRPPWAY